MTDQGDVLLYQTNDDGEINCVNGQVEMSSGLETAAYISLFGGNEQDPGEADKKLTYWANLSETETANQYRSKTQYLLRALPATSGNLKRIEAAALDDLAWMITEKVASDISVVATIPERNKIGLAVSIEANGDQQDFTYFENWKAAVA